MIRRTLPACLALALVSCALIPREPVAPLPSVTDDPEGMPAELVVLLPGRWSKPEEFREEGFLKLVRERHPRARIVAPDLHLGYCRDRSAIDRLHEDVVLPARREGIRGLTFVGISLGGLGAVLYDLEHPAIEKRLVLLSPFLGEEEVIEEIGAAGSLAAWQPGEIGSEDFSRRIWSGMRGRWSGGGGPPVLLGCGEDDRLAPTSRLLAREFPSSVRAVWIEGGHDWPTWNALYREFSRASEPAR